MVLLNSARPATKSDERRAARCAPRHVAAALRACARSGARSLRALAIPRAIERAAIEKSVPLTKVFDETVLHKSKEFVQLLVRGSLNEEFDRSG
jgi:hypothetical protein